MKTKNLLMLFTRNPELGKVKSRLAKDIGEVKALAIYKELLKHTHKISKNKSADTWLYYSEKIDKNDLWETSDCQKKIQKGSNLGAKMATAFKEGFAAGYEKIIIIGSDIYDLQEKHIVLAFEQLLRYDTVLGPAEDGGYYLFGMNFFIKEVFENKSWGTETVLKETVLDLEEKYTLSFLEVLNDIDVISDIKPDSYLAKYL
jgi:rSAM/selenodomain-associated transferase 1